MRRNILFFFVLVTALALMAAFFYKRSSRRSPDTVAVMVTNQVPAVVAAPTVAVAVPAKASSTPEEKEKRIQEETERLALLSMNDDPQSLSNILADLVSPEKEIRMAAIEATKQFDSTNAIPVLKAMVANTSDAEEAAALLEAAEFLSLPDANLVTPAASSPAPAR